MEFKHCKHECVCGDYVAPFGMGEMGRMGHCIVSSCRHDTRLFETVIPDDSKLKSFAEKDLGIFGTNASLNNAMIEIWIAGYKARAKGE